MLMISNLAWQASKLIIKKTGITSIQTLLYYGIDRFVDNDQIIELIDELNIDVNKQDEEGNTLLHYLAKDSNRYSDLIIFLIDNITHIEINKQNKKGETLLHNLARCSDYSGDLAESLISKGADRNIQNDCNDTPLLVALHNANPAIFKALYSDEIDLMNDKYAGVESPYHWPDSMKIKYGTILSLAVRKSLSIGYQKQAYFNHLYEVKNQYAEITEFLFEKIQERYEEAYIITELMSEYIESETFEGSFETEDQEKINVNINQARQYTEAMENCIAQNLQLLEARIHSKSKQIISYLNDRLLKDFKEKVEIKFSTDKIISELQESARHNQENIISKYTAQNLDIFSEFKEIGSFKEKIHSEVMLFLAYKIDSDSSYEPSEYDSLEDIHHELKLIPKSKGKEENSTPEPRGIKAQKEEGQKSKAESYEESFQEYPPIPVIGGDESEEKTNEQGANKELDPEIKLYLIYCTKNNLNQNNAFWEYAEQLDNGQSLEENITNILDKFAKADMLKTYKPTQQEAEYVMNYLRRGADDSKEGTKSLFEWLEQARSSISEDLKLVGENSLKGQESEDFSGESIE